MDRTAASLESNIDQAAEQTQAAIGVVGERVEGLIDEAPRQTASVVQSVRAPCWPCIEPFHLLHGLGCSWPGERVEEALCHTAMLCSQCPKLSHRSTEEPGLLCRPHKRLADF